MARRITSRKTKANTAASIKNPKIQMASAGAKANTAASIKSPKIATAASVVPKKIKTSGAMVSAPKLSGGNAAALAGRMSGLTSAFKKKRG